MGLPLRYHWLPLALDEFGRAGKIKPGDRVMMQGVCGGFTWGASLATMG